jgi:transposase
MTLVATIGLDIAKSVFLVHGVDPAGQVVVRQRLTRRRVLAFFEKLAPCLVGIEACSTSHYWATGLATSCIIPGGQTASYSLPQDLARMIYSFGN